MSSTALDAEELSRQGIRRRRSRDRTGESDTEQECESIQSAASTEENCEPPTAASWRPYYGVLLFLGCFLILWTLWAELRRNRQCLVALSSKTSWISENLRSAVAWPVALGANEMLRRVTESDVAWRLWNLVVAVKNWIWTFVWVAILSLMSLELQVVSLCVVWAIVFFAAGFKTAAWRAQWQQDRIVKTESSEA